MRLAAVAACTALAACAAVAALAATINSGTQAVLPQSTRQIVSLDYHRLASDPVAQQAETQVLPPQMQGLNALLEHGGIHPATDLNRLTFATYAATNGVGLIGVAEGNFGGLALSHFFHPTKKTPNPPQISGVNIYTSGSLTFFVPDSSTIVFGSKEAVTKAIATEQGAPNLGQNEDMTNLVAGTQSTDAWSVLDAQGTRIMVKSMLASSGSSGSGMAAGLIDSRLNGARYTIAFGNQVQVNLELITTDALSAAAVSTGLNAAIAIQQKREANPEAKAILGQIQVDSAGNHAFLQLSAPETELANLMHSDLMRSIVH